MLSSYIYSLNLNLNLNLSISLSQSLNTQVVQALLWIGADPYAEDAFGQTPLATADSYRNHQIVVGLRAVSKREKALAGNLSTYDEVVL
jgi:ankyrin repeat protein